MTKLIEELREFVNKDPIKKGATEYGYELGAKDGYMLAQARVDEILSRHEQDKAVEPLVVLADGKGCWPQIIRNRTKWVVDIFPIDKETGEDLEGEAPMFYACTPTYVEAEAKARAYLNGLTDKEGIK